MKLPLILAVVAFAAVILALAGWAWQGARRLSPA
jgi:hypothetical protein